MTCDEGRRGTGGEEKKERKVGAPQEGRQLLLQRWVYGCPWNV